MASFEASMAPFEASMPSFEASMASFKASMASFEASMPSFEASMPSFEPSIRCPCPSKRTQAFGRSLRHAPAHDDQRLVVLLRCFADERVDGVGDLVANQRRAVVEVCSSVRCLLLKFVSGLIEVTNVKLEYRRTLLIDVDRDLDCFGLQHSSNKAAVVPNKYGFSTIVFWSCGGEADRLSVVESD